MNSKNTTHAKISLNTSDSSYKLYQYDPLFPAAMTAIILFAIVTFYHVWLIKRHRSWYFIPFTIGGFCKWIRLYYFSHPNKLSYSRDYRLQWASLVSFWPYKNWRLCYAIHANSYCTCSFCCFNIYDFGTSHSSSWCRVIIYHPCLLDDKNICSWRYCLFLYAGQWMWPSSLWQPRYWSKGHHWGAFCANCHV